MYLQRKITPSIFSPRPSRNLRLNKSFEISTDTLKKQVTIWWVKQSSALSSIHNTGQENPTHKVSFFYWRSDSGNNGWMVQQYNLAIQIKIFHVFLTHVLTILSLLIQTFDNTESVNEKKVKALSYFNKHLKLIAETASLFDCLLISKKIFNLILLQNL